MKKLIFVLFAFLLASCNTQKKYSDFDYSFSRSGGFSPIYENLLIKGKNAHYSFEGHGKKIKKDFKISTGELAMVEKAIADNNFRTIQEDYKKVYDYIATSVTVKKGVNSASKSDAAFIIEKDKKRWDDVRSVFQNIISSHIKTSSSHQ